jgi:hypothetical protein
MSRCSETEAKFEASGEKGANPRKGIEIYCLC